MPSVINSTFSEGDEEVEIGTGTIQQPEYPSYFYYDFGFFGQIYKASEIGVSQPITITAYYAECAPKSQIRQRRRAQP